MSRLDLAAAERIEIGGDVLIGANVTIRDADHGHTLTDIHPIDQPLVISPVAIGPFVWIGQNVVILKGVEIGRGAVVGAGAVVTASVEPHAIVAGNPARRVGWADRGDEAVSG